MRGLQIGDIGNMSLIANIFVFNWLLNVFLKYKPQS